MGRGRFQCELNEIKASHPITHKISPCISGEVFRLRLTSIPGLHVCDSRLLGAKELKKSSTLEFTDLYMWFSNGLSLNSKTKSLTFL
jgi:hypothetical protein